MAENVFGPTGVVAHGPFNGRLSMADTTIHLPPYDTVAAKAMLDSSGWRVGPDGMRAKNGKALRFTLLIPTSSVPRRRYGVLIQEALRRLGARVDLDLTDVSTLIARQHSGDFDAMLQTFLTDPSVGDTRQTWGTVGIATGDNFLRYSNPAVDALLDSALIALDPVEAKGYASRAFQALANDAPAVWLYDLFFLGAVNRRITVVPGRADEWWENLADWSIPPDKRIDRDRIGLPAAKP
jgi:peptide/nickel transport system substrate-binding protein